MTWDDLREFLEPAILHARRLYGTVLVSIAPSEFREFAHSVVEHGRWVNVSTTDGSSFDGLQLPAHYCGVDYLLVRPKRGLRKLEVEVSPL